MKPTVAFSSCGSETRRSKTYSSVPSFLAGRGGGTQSEAHRSLRKDCAFAFSEACESFQRFTNSAIVIGGPRYRGGVRRVTTHEVKSVRSFPISKPSLAAEPGLAAGLLLRRRSPTGEARRDRNSVLSQRGIDPVACPRRFQRLITPASVSQERSVVVVVVRPAAGTARAQPGRLPPALILRVVDHRADVVVGINHPARLGPLVQREPGRLHHLELLQIRDLELQRRGRLGRNRLVDRDIDLRM